MFFLVKLNEFLANFLKSMIFFKYLSVFLPSMVKFFFGLAAGKALRLSWIETYLLTVSGMMATVVILGFLGKKSLDFFKKDKKFKMSNKKRRLVKIWRKYGIFGVSILTPLLLTPIGGTLVAVSFGEKFGKICFYMLLSGLFWGAVLCAGVYYIF